jgi:hypothetical protein
MNPDYLFYRNFVLGLIAVGVVSLVGVRLIYFGLSGRSTGWFRSLSAPPWFLVLAGLVLQIPTGLYLYLGFNSFNQ